MNPFLCVYGHLALDHILALERFPALNTSVDVVEKRRYYGGTAGNMATLASALGVPTAVVSYVGKDFSQDYKEFMLSHGVIMDDLVEVEGEETPTIWVVSDKDHNQIAYVFQGAMARMDRYPLRTDKAEVSEWVHICTGRPGYYLRLIERLKSLGKRIAFDPAQEIHHIWSREEFRRALPGCDLLFANRGEMERALSYMNARQPQDLLDRVDIIVNTRGTEGSVIYTSSGEIVVPSARPEKVVDTTGAGDAFRAGFYAGRYRGFGLRESAALGSALASFVVETKGALSRVPSWEEVLVRARPCME